MFFKYLKLSLRNLLRDHIYSAINIGGLALGIATSVLLLMWTQEELSYDRMHEKEERLYRVNAQFNNSGDLRTWPTSPAPLGVRLKNETTLIEDFVRLSGDNGTLLFTYKDKSLTIGDMYFTDPSFFKIFDFKIIQGNASNPFPTTKSVWLTETTAKKLFGDEDPMGKVIQREKKSDLVVAGILADLPSNSTIKFSMLSPYEDLIEETVAQGGKRSDIENNWGDYYYETFLLIGEESNTSEIEKSLTAIHHANQKETSVAYVLQPLRNLHLYAADGSEQGIQNVRIFIIVAIGILLIACINYINLATARATRRAKEVGVRKTVGATRGKLVFQFLMESGIVSLMAILLASVIIQLLIPMYNEITGKQLMFSFENEQTLILLGSCLVATWLIAGLYPALVLSSFKPVEIMKSKIQVSGGNSIFRRVLVVTQFTLSIMIIVGTLMVGQQLEYINTKDIGFQKEQVFLFSFRGDMYKNADAIRNELKSSPVVAEVSFANQNVGNIGNTTGDTDWDGKDPNQMMLIHAMNIDEKLMPMLEMQLTQGTGFTGARTDTAGFILNETAIEYMGIKEPIGKRFKLWQMEGTIVGVMKDFHHQSIHHKIEPTAFFYNKNWLQYIYVKTVPGKNAEAVALAESIYKKYNPAYPFDYRFLDDSFDAMYKEEARIGLVANVFSAIAICISCLGLFGLATFTAGQRVKEIGIRKVMGASVQQIVMLLSKDFIILVFIAFAIAVPLSYLAVQQWLDGFAYRTEITGYTYLLTGFLVLLVAVITVSFQTIKAALSNPVESLRNE